MLYPSINDLLKKADSRYTLVMMASKRARQLVEGDSPNVDEISNKPVSIAIHEIAEDKIGYTRNSDDNIEDQETDENIENIENIEDIETIENDESTEDN